MYKTTIYNTTSDKQNRRIRLSDVSAFISMLYQPVILLFRCLVDKVHELVELRSYDNLGAAVALLSGLGIVGHKRIILAASTCREAFRVDAIMVLQVLNHARCTQAGKVPVVADILH